MSETTIIDEMMTPQWPPPGHRFSYQVSESFDNARGITYYLTVPGVPGRGFDISTVRVGRLGGDTPDDLVFRDDLFRCVGSITVAGGHIEAAMKRLLLVLTKSDAVFSLVDHQWADLEKLLRAQCDSTDQRRKQLSTILDWAEKHNLRERRHDAVHGAWWPYAGIGARLSRWPRKEQDRVMIGELREFQRIAQRCWSYAYQLDDVLGEGWPRAMLPEPNPRITP